MKKALMACALVVALALPATAAAKITVLDPSAPGTPITVAKTILAEEAQLTTASFTEWAAGPDLTASPTGFGDVAEPTLPTTLAGFPTFGNTYGILSSGDVNDIATMLTNTASGTTHSFSEQFPSPSTIDRGVEANDYTVLAVQVTVPISANCLALDYRFLSEEFPEFVGSSFNDAFIAEIDATTWSVGESGVLSRPNDFAVSPGGQPISINGVGDTSVFESEAAGTYFDAATGLITTKSPITPGAHTIYLSIFDASDSSLDSAVLLDNLRFFAEDASTCRPPEGKELVLPPPPPPPPPGVTPPPPPPPSNAFAPGPKVVFGKAGTQATLTVTVPGPGTLAASSPAAGIAARIAVAEASAKGKGGKGKGKGKAKAKGKKGKGKKARKKPLLRSTSVRANAAGPVKITVKLSKTGKKLLKKRGTLKVPVTLTFTPDGGTPASQIRSITFKKATAKKGKGKAKGKGGKGKGGKGKGGKGGK